MNRSLIHKILSSEIRLDILDLVSRDALSVDDLAEKLSVRPISIRQHLRQLEQAGLVESQLKRSGIGRPKVVYRATNKFISLSYPPRKYLYLSFNLVETLLNEFGEEKTKEIFKKLGEKQGKEIIEQIALRKRIDKWTPELFAKHVVLDFLGEIGAKPEIIEVSNKAIRFKLNNCIFYEISSKWPQIICTGHNSLFKAMSSKVFSKENVKRLSCMGEGDPYCEMIIEIIEI